MTTTDRELLIQALAALYAVRLADLGDHIDLPDIIRQHLARPADACADLDAIRAKAETFFEWLDDAGEKHRDYVTFASCLLFARDCVNDWQAKHQAMVGKIDQLSADIQTEIVTLLGKVDVLEAENARLRQAIEITIADNLHLADGDVCTLIDLKRAVDWDNRPHTEEAP